MTEQIRSASLRDAKTLSHRSRVNLHISGVLAGAGLTNALAVFVPQLFTQPVYNLIAGLGLLLTAIGMALWAGIDIDRSRAASMTAAFGVDDVSPLSEFENRMTARRALELSAEQDLLPPIEYDDTPQRASGDVWGGRS